MGKPPRPSFSPAHSSEEDGATDGTGWVYRSDATPVAGPELVDRVPPAARRVFDSSQPSLIKRMSWSTINAVTLPFAIAIAIAVPLADVLVHGAGSAKEAISKRIRSRT